MNAIAGSKNGAGARVPRPPGTMRTSSSGAVLNVCVGRTDSPKVELMGLFHDAVFSVATGSKLVDRSVRLMVLQTEEVQSIDGSEDVECLEAGEQDVSKSSW